MKDREFLAKRRGFWELEKRSSRSPTPRFSFSGFVFRRWSWGFALESLPSPFPHCLCLKGLHLGWSIGPWSIRSTLLRYLSPHKKKAYRRQSLWSVLLEMVERWECILEEPLKSPPLSIQSHLFPPFCQIFHEKEWRPHWKGKEIYASADFLVVQGDVYHAGKVADQLID